MEPRVLHALELSAAIFGQTVILASAWGFFCALLIQSPRVLPDFLADFVLSKQAATTWTFTLLATILSVATTTSLSIAFKEALRHRMHKSISLVQLSSAIALARGSFLINFRHPIPALMTLAVFGVTRLLVSSWTTLLTPTLVTWSVDASGWELDLTSGSFELMLQQDLVRNGAALVRGNSTEIFDLDGVLSGIAAAQYSFGAPGLFDFNGVQYNISTGGVLPAVSEYSGTIYPVSSNNTGLGFAGGQVPTHLHVNFPGGLEQRGLQHGFTLIQQGLTADVTCQRIDNTTGNSNYSSSFNAIPVPLANGTTDYWLWAWNITADCGEGQPAQQQYVTRSNSSTVPQGSSSGFLSFLVCPYPLGQSGVSWEQFTVITNATWRFSFLPPMTCTINPLVTTSRVNYANGVVNTTVISSQPLDRSGNSTLSLFLAAIVNHQSLTTQSLTTNAIGDALYAIYISALDDSITSDEAVTDLLLRELEQFWRGVVEFSGTFLRSAFSVTPHGIPPESRVPVRGEEVIVTMGWYYRSAYVIIPITVVALMAYAAIAYVLWHVFVEQGHESFTVFDPSNPIHLMMVSSTKDNHDKDNLDDWLAGFEHGGIGRNENVRVQLTNVTPYRKRFGVTARDSGAFRWSKFGHD